MRRLGLAALAIAAAAAAAVGGAGCVAEYDVDVYATLPVIPTACETIGAASLALHVMPDNEPAFDLAVTGCADELQGEPIAGFYVQIPRLTAGKQHLAATISDATGATLGVLDREFSATDPVELAFARDDLPAWPTTELDVAVAGCVPDGPVIAAELAALPAGATMPSATTELSCADPGPAALIVPTGPVTVSAIGIGADGEPCWAGSIDADPLAATAVSVALTRSCP